MSKQTNKMKTATNRFGLGLVVISPDGVHGRRIRPCTWSGDDLITVQVPDDWTIVTCDTERDTYQGVAPTVKMWHKTLRELAALCGRQFTKACTGTYYESACYTLTVT